MAGQEPVWVVANPADARALPAPPARGAVLALTPTACAELVGTAWPRLDALRHYGDWGQARTVAAVRRARAKLGAAAAALPGARPIHREIALDLFARAAYTGYRLWFTLGPAGPWMIRDGAEWRLHETREAAYRALLDHMLAPIVAGHTAVARAEAPPLPGLYRMLRGWVLRLCCGRRITFVAGARKGMFGLLDTVAGEAAPARIVVVQGEGGGWRDYLRLARNVWRAMRGARFVDAALLVGPRGDFGRDADALIASVGDAVIAAAFARYRGLIAYRLAQIGPALADGRAIVGAARPRHYVSAEVSRLSDWVLAEICGETRATRWVMSRNTHVPAASRMAEDACHGYLLARYPDGMVDRYLFWSPHGAAAARAVLPRERWSAVEAVAAVPVAPATILPKREGGARRVLLADSFATFWFTHSWAFQTSDEYLSALADLIKVVESLPDTQLIVRAKNKIELGIEAYRKLVPPSDRVSIKIRDVPFQQDLADCDVLVAFRSSTIEEAVHARRPALIWGGSARYRYLPPRTTPPTPGDRAPIYAADSAAALAAMLPAILAAHADRPLTDAEIAAHIWPAATPGVRDLARRMVEECAAPPIADASADSGLRQRPIG